MSGDIAWTANLATGRARCLHRYFKGEAYARSMDLLDGVPHTPVCDRAGAVLHARALVELGREMLAHLEGESGPIGGASPASGGQEPPP